MNPFNPNFGNVPTIFIDRSQQLKKIIDGLDNFGSPYQTTLVYGLRGVGKTSFLTDISQTISKRDNWIVINLALGDDLMSSFIQLIYRKANSNLKKLLDQSDIDFSAFGLKFSHSHQTKEQSFRVMVEETLQKLQQQNIKLLVTIDEARSTPEIKEFATVYQLMRRENYNISLIMTGLPDKVSELQNDDVLTFLLRSGRIILEPLNAISMKFSYQKAFKDGNREIDDETLNKLLQMTNGYAYGFQLLGYLLWETGDKVIAQSTIDKVIDEYQEMLYRNVYVKIYESLSDVDREFVYAMISSSKKQIPISEISDKLAKPKNYVSIYRRRLIDDQIITSPKWGYVSFTLPYFENFVLEFGEMY